jgi:hypothetical protein
MPLNLVDISSRTQPLKVSAGTSDCAGVGFVPPSHSHILAIKAAAGCNAAGYNA